MSFWQALQLRVVLMLFTRVYDYCVHFLCAFYQSLKCISLLVCAVEFVHLCVALLDFA